MRIGEKLCGYRGMNMIKTHWMEFSKNQFKKIKIKTRILGTWGTYCLIVEPLPGILGVCVQFLTLGTNINLCSEN